MTEFEKMALRQCLQNNMNNVYNPYISGNPFVIGQQTLTQTDHMANYELLYNPNINIDELKTQLANANLTASQQTQEERMTEILNHYVYGADIPKPEFSEDEKEMLDGKIPSDLVSTAWLWFVGGLFIVSLSLLFL